MEAFYGSGCHSSWKAICLYNHLKTHLKAVRFWVIKLGFAPQKRNALQNLSLHRCNKSVSLGVLPFFVPCKMFSFTSLSSLINQHLKISLDWNEKLCLPLQGAHKPYLHRAQRGSPNRPFLKQSVQAPQGRASTRQLQTLLSNTLK